METGIVARLFMPIFLGEVPEKAGQVIYEIAEKYVITVIEMIAAGIINMWEEK